MKDTTIKKIMRIILACALLLIVPGAAAAEPETWPPAALPPDTNYDNGTATTPPTDIDWQRASLAVWPEQPPTGVLQAVSHEITRLPDVETSTKGSVSRCDFAAPLPPEEIAGPANGCARCQDCCFGGLCDCAPCRPSRLVSRRTVDGLDARLLGATVVDLQSSRNAHQRRGHYRIAHDHGPLRR